MSNDQVSIGQSKFGGGQQFQKTKWHKLIAGNNYYRVLPPLFSLAASGEYKKYWAFHGGFKNTKGGTQMFQCVEEKDRKSKLITQHCPVCDTVAALIGQHDQYKAMIATGQVTKEQVKAFWDSKIFPIKAQKSFFVNAIDQQGEVGILALPYKAYQAFEEACKTVIKDRGVDPTSVNGAWMNIKKIQPFPGSPQVSHGAEIALENTADGGVQLKRHTLTTEFIQNTIKTSARDLGTLFRVISPSDAAQLVSVPYDQVGPVVDRLFGKPEEQPKQDGALTLNVPGAQATVVGRVEATPNGGLGVVMPTLPQSGNGLQNNSLPNLPPTAAPLANMLPPLGAAPTVNALPTLAAVGQSAAFVAPTAQPAVGAPQVSAMTDDQFRDMFSK